MARPNIYLEQQKKEAYEARLLQNKVRRRIERIRNSNTSQQAVEAYDTWKSFYDKAGSWEKMHSSTRASFVEDLKAIDNYKTSTFKGAKEHHQKNISLWGSKYENMTKQEQSRLWNRVKIVSASYMGGLDSEQAITLVRYEQEHGYQNIGLDYQVNPMTNEIEFYTPESQKRFDNFKGVIERERELYDNLKK